MQKKNHPDELWELRVLLCSFILGDRVRGVTLRLSFLGGFRWREFSTCRVAGVKVFDVSGWREGGLSEREPLTCLGGERLNLATPGGAERKGDS